MKKQKFKRGDVVHVAADLGPGMAHFTADKDAIVMERSDDEYTLMFCDDGDEESWYDGYQLTFIRHGGEAAIQRVLAATAVLEAKQTDLKWIVKNWPNLRPDSVPGATIDHLMKLIGITDPWGSRGEGLTYYVNAQMTYALLDPVLSSGSLAKVKGFLSKRMKSNKNSK